MSGALFAGWFGGIRAGFETVAGVIEKFAAGGTEFPIGPMLVTTVDGHELPDNGDFSFYAIAILSIFSCMNGSFHRITYSTHQV